MEHPVRTNILPSRTFSPKIAAAAGIAVLGAAALVLYATRPAPRAEVRPVYARPKPATHYARTPDPFYGGLSAAGMLTTMSLAAGSIDAGCAIS